MHWTHETDLKVLKLLKAMASLLLCIVHFIGALPTSGSGTAFAQELRPPLTLTSTPPGKMSFAEAINVSIANYPAVAAAIASEDAAAAHITLAKTAYLPRFDLVVQENRSSFNDAFNVYLPSLIDLPIVNGPLQRRRSFDSVWSATSGSVLEWELIDFGLRRARVKLSRTQTDAAKAVTGLTKLDVSVAAANAFFALVATQQRVRAEKANVERMQVFCTTVDALVAAELRAGVDSSMALAELAQARDRLIRAEQAADVARANLAERLGLAGTSVYIVDGPFLLIPEAPKAITLPPFELHPLAIARAADVRVVESRLFVLKKSWFPHIYGQSVMQARGGGDNRGGALAHDGYLPVIPNWSVGLTATFRMMDYFKIRACEKIEHANERAARARYAQTMQVLKGQDARAKALIEGAQRLAANAPTFLKAAQDTESRARTRYKVGLGTVVEVADAERLLTDAQVTNDLAGLSVWRAFFAASVSRGDIGPFLQLVSAAPTAPGG